LSEESGIHLRQVRVHRHDLGGGFCRRGGTQGLRAAGVQIAKEFPDFPGQADLEPRGRPGARFLPPDLPVQDECGLDAQGNLVGLHLRVSGQSINAWLNPGGIQNGRDMRQLQGYYVEPGDAQLGYTVPNLLIEYAMRNTHVPVGPWRASTPTRTASTWSASSRSAPRRAARTSLEFRRALMQNHRSISPCSTLRRRRATGASRCRPASSRHRAVHGLRQLLGRRRRGLGEPQGKLKVHRMVLALELRPCGQPGQIAAQVEGSVAYGLSATLYGECRSRRAA
jgi:isoquinoline 1-oxidoreductase beta subunit